MKYPAAFSHRQLFVARMLTFILLCYSESIMIITLVIKTKNNSKKWSWMKYTIRQTSDAKDSCSEEEKPQKVGPIASRHQLTLDSGLWFTWSKQIVKHRSSPLKGIQKAVLAYCADTDLGEGCRGTVIPYETEKRPPSGTLSMSFRNSESDHRYKDKRNGS